MAGRPLPGEYIIGVAQAITQAQCRVANQRAEPTQRVLRRPLLLGHTRLTISLPATPIAHTFDRPAMVVDDLLIRLPTDKAGVELLPFTRGCLSNHEHPPSHAGSDDQEDAQGSA
jgi:hypothetical protein